MIFLFSRELGLGELEVLCPFETVLHWNSVYNGVFSFFWDSNSGTCLEDEHFGFWSTSTPKFTGRVKDVQSLTPQYPSSWELCFLIIWFLNALGLEHCPGDLWKNYTACGWLKGLLLSGIWEGLITKKLSEKGDVSQSKWWKRRKQRLKFVISLVSPDSLYIQ